MVEVSASLLSVENIESTKLFLDLETAKIDYFHIDVMDGKFVEKNTLNQMYENASSIALVSSIGMDVHLMVKDVDKYVEEYLPFNPKIITFHIEAVKDESDILKTINKIKSSGSRVGIAINPDTDIEKIKQYLDKIHVAFVMTVYPGKGGQKLIPETLDKVSKLKKYITENDLDTEIEVDGGINDLTYKDTIDAGADIIAVGSYLVFSDNFSETVKKIKTND
ncbi:MAG: ribulose-phosphate 3-epimerase [Clostridia bacterium]|nr:ribulose-phosphate 3-epimerase [Clostridia bacterium]